MGPDMVKCSSPDSDEVLIENLIQAAHEYEQAEGSAAKYLRGEYSKARHALREHIAQLQYEAGMYKSLYENAFAQTVSPSSADISEALERLNSIADCLIVDGTPVDAYGRFELTYGDLRALRTAIQSRDPAQGWRDISTAPKDGTRILFCYCDDSSAVVLPMMSGFWSRLADEWFSDITDRKCNPTHWMPLPAAPTLPSTQSEAPAVRVPKVRTSHHRNKEEAARLQTLVDKRYVWPAGCHDPDSCARHLGCMYVQCKRHNKDGNEVAKEINDCLLSSPVREGGK